MAAALLSHVYDSDKAKWAASVRWLVAKAGDGVYPPEYGEPFCDTSEGEVVLNPVIASGLTSADLYCRACNAVFLDSCNEQQGHIGIIQVLARRGIDVGGHFEDFDSFENLLMETEPLCQAAHLALIDALMAAYSSRIASVERVVQAVRKFATFSSSSELPLNVEDCLLFWLNKSWLALTKRLQVTPPPQPLSDLREIADGCCLASVVSFYRHNDLPSDAIAFSGDVADSLYNIRLVETFCLECLPTIVFHVTTDDLFHCTDELRPNIVAFLADLFHCLESIGIDNGSPSLQQQQQQERIDRVTYGNVTVAATVSRPPVIVPAISETTKRSFQHPPGVGSNTPVPVDAATATAARMASLVASSGHRQPLLPRRQINNAPDCGVGEAGYRPLEAWPSRSNTRVGNESERSDTSLLSNVDISASFDFDPNDTVDISLDGVDSMSTARSQAESNGTELPALSSRGNPLRPTVGSLPLGKTQTLSSLPSRGSGGPISSASYTVAAAAAALEPLQPARLRPAKEKTNNDSKKQESGEVAQRLTKPPSPLRERDADAESDSTPSEGYQTPLQSNSPNREGDASDIPGASSSAHSFVYNNASGVNNVFDPTHSYVVSSSNQSTDSTLSGRDTFRQMQPGGVGPDDSELYKLRTDSTVKEQQKDGMNASLSGSSKNLYENENSPAMRTSFAKLRKFKEKSMGGSFESPVIYDQHQGGLPTSGQTKSVVIINPSQTTWMEAAKIQRSQSMREVVKPTAVNTTDGTIAPAQLAGVRMELEERRRMIESGKRSAVMQRSRLNQQAGQEAFVKVIRKENPMTSKNVPVQVTQPPSNQAAKASNVKAVTSRAASVDSSPRAAVDLPGVGKMNLEQVAATAQTSQQLTKDKTFTLREQQPITNSLVKEAKSSEAKPQPSAALPGISAARASVAETGRQTVPVTASTSQRRQTPDDTRRSSVAQDSPRSTGSDSATQMAGSWQVVSSKSSTLEPPAGMTFDRLSSSLSDLQAEIARLTQQQDEIKSLVSGGGNNGGGNNGGGSAGAPAVSEQNTFYLYPPTDRTTASQTAPAQSTTAYSSTFSTMSQSIATPQPAPQNSVQPMQAYPHPPPDPHHYYAAGYGAYGHPSHAPSMPGGAMYGSPMPPMMPRYPMNSPYTSPPYQQDPMAMYHPQPTPDALYRTPPGGPTPSDAMYRTPSQHVTPHASLGDIPYPGHWPNAQQTPPSFYLGGPQYPDHRQAQYPVAPPPTQQIPPEQPPQINYQPVPPAVSPRPPEVPPPVQTPVTQATAFFVDTSTLPPVLPSPSSGTANSGTSVSSAGTSPAVATPVTTSQPMAFFVDASPSTNVRSSPAPQSTLTSGGSVSRTSQAAAAFFVDTSPSVFTGPPPLSAENLFPLSRETEPVSSSSAPESVDSRQTSPGGRSDLGSTPGGSTTGDTDTTATVGLPAVVFVISEEQPVEDSSEMERRKQRLHEQQMRRKEEQEQKRMALEMELSRKREAQKSKQEEDEKRRVEEKARRDAIFEKYMKRKMAIEGNSEVDSMQPTSAAGSAAASNKPLSSVSQVVLRKRAPGAVRQTKSRPMSQPPPASSAGHLGAVAMPTQPSFVTGHASDDSLLESAAASSLSQGIDKLSSNPDLRDPTYFQLAHGGLTHRRPQTPDRSSHHDIGFQQPIDYTGPKLFVKPSQKSNRSIVINAISHCCLAGVVNRDKVDKAIEEINKSTAMQFIILFRDAGMQYRGLYTYNPDDVMTNEVLLTKIHGTGPKQLSSKTMERFYKYNCGAKNFTEVTSTKHLTTTIDAVTVLNSVWLKYRLPAPGSSATKKPL